MRADVKECVCVAKCGCMRVAEFTVKRAPENGGDVRFETYEELEQAFSKEVHFPVMRLIYLFF
jgi:hypothetical protein